MTTTTHAVEEMLGLAAGWRRPEDPTLADEHERLFVGPGRVPCPPYESLWRADTPPRTQGSLLGPCVPDLESCYAGLGVQVSQDAHELPDNLVVELEALAVALAAPGATAVARALVCDHLSKWVPAFCRAVTANAESEHYRDLAALTTRQILDLERGLSRSDD